MAKLGSIPYQCQQALEVVNDIGHSKHTAASEARAGGAANSHEVAQETGIYSYKYGSDCLNTWVAAAKWCKETFGIKDIKQLDGGHLRTWIEHKVDEGLTARSANTYVGQLAKFGVALERMDGQARAFGPELTAARSYVSDNAGRTVHENRAFVNPQAVAGTLERPEHRLAGEIQIEAGPRVREVGLIKADQLIGQNQVEVEAKGGQIVTLTLAPETYSKLSHHIAQNGDFRIDINAYRADIKQACEAVGEKYSGPHSFRYNFAQQYYKSRIDAGLSHDEARRETAEKMGHHRCAITSWYVGL